MTTPLFMRDVSLTLKLLTGTRAEFNCDAKLAEVLANAGDTVDYKTLCPEGSFSNVGSSTYALHIVAAQDWGPDGLARFLWDNEGELAEFQYQAHGAALAASTDAPGMTGTVRLLAPSYGGEVETYAELDVEMPCTEKPTIAIAAFPTAAAAGEELEPATAAA